PELEPSLQHLKDLSIRHLVNFICKHEMRTRARSGLPRLLRHRSEETGAPVISDVEFATDAAAKLKNGSEVRRMPNHLHGIGKHDLCLVALACRAVDLRPGLAIRHESVKPYSSAQRRFAVTLALLYVRATESSPPINTLPAE